MYELQPISKPQKIHGIIYITFIVTIVLNVWKKIYTYVLTEGNFYFANIKNFV